MKPFFVVLLLLGVVAFSLCEEEEYDYGGVLAQDEEQTEVETEDGSEEEVEEEEAAEDDSADKNMQLLKEVGGIAGEKLLEFGQEHMDDIKDAIMSKIKKPKAPKGGLAKIKGTKGGKGLNKIKGPKAGGKIKIKNPKIKTPKVKTPKIKTPKIKTPKVKTPKIKTPKIKTPKFKTPKIFG